MKLDRCNATELMSNPPYFKQAVKQHSNQKRQHNEAVLFSSYKWNPKCLNKEFPRLCQYKHSTFTWR